MVAAASRRRLATTSVVTGSSFIILDRQNAVRVDRRRLAREHHGGGVELVDDGGALDAVARQELGAVIDPGGDEAVLFEVEERALAGQGARAVAVAGCEALQLEARHLDLGLE